MAVARSVHWIVSNNMNVAMKLYDEILHGERLRTGVLFLK